MFLAWNEIKHAKLRYSLVMGVMFLIAYLVFFLTGLAYGLAQDNRTAIDKWQADTILLSKEANSNLNMSMIAKKELDNVDAKDKALLAQTPGVIVDNSSEDNENNAWLHYFTTDTVLDKQRSLGKNGSCYIRAIRQF